LPVGVVAAAAAAAVAVGGAAAAAQVAPRRWTSAFQVAYERHMQCLSDGLPANILGRMTAVSELLSGHYEFNGDWVANFNIPGKSINEAAVSKALRCKQAHTDKVKIAMAALLAWADMVGGDDAMVEGGHVDRRVQARSQRRRSGSSQPYTPQQRTGTRSSSPLASVSGATAQERRFFVCHGPVGHMEP